MVASEVSTLHKLTRARRPMLARMSAARTLMVAGEHHAREAAQEGCHHQADAQGVVMGQGRMAPRAFASDVGARAWTLADRRERGMRVAAVEDQHDGPPIDFCLACRGAAQAVSKRVCEQPGMNMPWRVQPWCSMRMRALHVGMCAQVVLCEVLRASEWCKLLSPDNWRVQQPRGAQMMRTCGKGCGRST